MKPHHHETESGDDPGDGGSGGKKDGLDSVAISDLTNQQILSDLEAWREWLLFHFGNCQGSIQVLIRQEKIDEVSDRVRNAVSGEFAERHSRKLDDARTELGGSEQKMSDAKAEIDSGRSQLEAR